MASACIQIEKPFEKAEYSFPRENGDGYCIFFDKGAGKCVTHPVKPETCVAGPVTFDIDLKTGKIEWFLKTEKICPLAGVLYKDRKALSNHLKLAKRELLALVHGLSTKELCAILKIEELETFKIGQNELNPSTVVRLRTDVTSFKSGGDGA